LPETAYSASDVVARVDAAARAFVRWRQTTLAERSHRLARLGELVRARTPLLARLITSEVSKTLRGSIAELTKSADYCVWLGEHGPRILAPREVAGGASIRYEPLGVVAGIMPWNFPFWQVFRFAAPALLAGNTVVVKHSPLVPRCADAIEELFRDAGFGEGVLSCCAASAQDAQQLIAHAGVRAVHFTGGGEAGRAVASAAGAHLKKCVLELGGSDAFVVMPSADLDVAVAAAVTSRIRAGGQACTAAKRFIVHRRVAGEFESRLVRAMESLVIGDPLDPRTDVAPLVTEAFADQVERQVRDSVAAGATILCGGVRLAPRLYAPTVVATSTTRIALMQEETFGPVAPVLRVDSLAGAIAAANDTQFGLSASVWTSDEHETSAFVRDLEVGQVFINAVTSSRFDLPFGGTKNSGFGRELGDEGVLEFLNVKAVQRISSR
jgi:succinate-semialdehyde dehydrogenase/glutarate-semialdehyde dehydrogenase